MNQVTATVTLDQEKGTVKFSMDLQGDTELDHELLTAAIGTSRSVSVTPAHNGEELFAEFTITDASIWPKALRSLENRKRALEGKPSVEEEEAQEAMAKAAAEDAKNAPQPPTAEEKMSTAIADGIAKGLKAAGVAPKS